MLDHIAGFNLDIWNNPTEIHSKYRLLSIMATELVKYRAMN